MSEVEDGDVRSHMTLAPVEEVFVDQHARLWRSVVLWSGSTDVASDAVAEAFAQLLARGDAVRDPAAWVWKAAFRIAAGELARARRTPAVEVAPDAPDVEGLIDVVNALRHLSERQRAAVVLADFAGYPHADIARILGSSTSAVGVHVHRGRRKLRSLLEVNDD